VVQGVRKELSFPCKKDCYLMEINFGPFYREIEFPGSIDADATRAFYRQGFLIIECKKRITEAKRIPVS
ncbi:MAG: Hsp20/alpha crystallin family protein, partial [Atribacterota bacterium]|nr:Hsp20/alpha crystallin family protein [Atribacterota bacterium]